MRPSIYNNEYKLNHPNFKSVCLKNFPYFLKTETWFTNNSSSVYKPFMDDKIEKLCWKKYIESNRKNKFIEKELFSRYIWLTFRILLFVNDVQHNKENEDEFEESIILLYNCIKLFDISMDCSFFSYYCESLKRYLKRFRVSNKLFVCGNIRPSTYLIQHIITINKEDPNKKIKDSLSAMILKNNLNLTIRDTDIIEKLIDDINDRLFTNTKQIYGTNDNETREEIYLEDVKDYNYDIKKKIL